MTVLVSSTLIPTVAVEEIEVDDANRLLVEWQHNLGPCNRPFGQQAFALHIDGHPISVALSASMVSKHVSDIEGNIVATRGETVELARLASAEPWATRVMIRLWREVHAHAWPYWPVWKAISYHQNNRHTGDVYRFDGWEKIRCDSGSSGGGAWSRKRYASDEAHGKKTLWLWRYDTDRPRKTNYAEEE